MEISYEKLEFIKAHSQLDGQRVFVEGLIDGLSKVKDGSISISKLIEGLEEGLSEINDALKMAEVFA